MSLLTRAAKRFDAAFAALPPEVQSATALAIYRAAPAIQQYQRDLAPFAQSEGIQEAIWDLFLAFGWQAVKKGREGFGASVVEQLAGAAPVTTEFMRKVGKALEPIFGKSAMAEAPASLALESEK